MPQMYGMIVLSKKEIPFSYDREKELFTLYAGSTPIELPEGIDILVGQKFGMLAGGKTLYKLSTPLSNDGLVSCGVETKTVSICNQIREIEYCINDYYEDSKYSEMRLRFSELDYLLPSMSRARCEEGEIVFSRAVDSVCSFDILFRGSTISVDFIRSSEGQTNVKTTVSTFSEIRLKFSETDDLEYINDLFHTTRGFFEFICNRKNIGLRSAVLVGEYPGRKIENGIPVEVQRFTKQTMYFNQKYLEPLEEMDRIKKTPNIGIFIGKLQGLFQLFFEEKESGIPIANADSCHPSVKFRNLIDLEQSLHITAAFEYYVRTLLPEISSQETMDFLNDIESIVDEYIEKATGKKKKKAKDFKKSLKPQISLEEKILKVYGGYKGWEPLNTILTEWFGDDVSELARAANIWRNELAHEKREYQPNRNVINAVRLVEHLNYCIVLRHAGYDNEEIKNILTDVLTR